MMFHWNMTMTSNGKATKAEKRSKSEVTLFCTLILFFSLSLSLSLSLSQFFTKETVYTLVCADIHHVTLEPILFLTPKDSSNPSQSSSLLIAASVGVPPHRHVLSSASIDALYLFPLCHFIIPVALSPPSSPSSVFPLHSIQVFRSQILVTLLSSRLCPSIFWFSLTSGAPLCRVDLRKGSVDVTSNFTIPIEASEQAPRRDDDESLGRKRISRFGEHAGIAWRCFLL